MTRLGWMVFGGGMVLILLAAAALVFFHKPTAYSVQEPQEQKMPIVTDPSSLSIYTNGVYGFSFFYPADGEVTDTFASSSPNQSAWRTNASNNGTLVVRVQSTQGTLTVGESTNAHERTVCLKEGPAERTLAPLTIGSTTWQHFYFEKLGTENPRRVTSYRTIHKNACIAFEIAEPLSATASTTIYSLANSIESFTFAP